MHGSASEISVALTQFVVIRVNRMLRMILKIFGLQFACFCLLLLCCAIAGQEKGVFWFALIAVTLLLMTVIGKIAKRSQ
jgi:hypothetical protein